MKFDKLVFESLDEGFGIDRFDDAIEIKYSDYYNNLVKQLKYLIDNSFKHLDRNDIQKAISEVTENYSLK